MYFRAAPTDCFLRRFNRVNGRECVILSGAGVTSRNLFIALRERPLHGDRASDRSH